MALEIPREVQPGAVLVVVWNPLSFVTVATPFCPIRNVGWPILTTDGNIAIVHDWDDLVAGMTFMVGDAEKLLHAAGVLVPITEWTGAPLDFDLSDEDSST